MLCDQFMAE